ncbi:hypothetical protein EVG20_g1408 [Dentipellis fragilis]|uniref:Uncharacterized protein n=1 Tax=Dentipellis fragilis TaxID=205917 RepID=A0A4Y9ZA02_9AGAM|nr:hypothetical protein EVG20_g1408 [Dentipellis fragilis]
MDNFDGNPELREAFPYSAFNLRYLELQNFTVSSMPSAGLLRNLTSFVSHGGLMWTLPQCLDVLRRMPALKTLRLHFPFQSVQWNRYVYECPRMTEDVSLPRLCELSLACTDSDAAAFFHRITLNPLTSVYLNVPSVDGVPLDRHSLIRVYEKIAKDFHLEFPRDSAGFKLRWIAEHWTPSRPGHPSHRVETTLEVHINKGSLDSVNHAADFTDATSLCSSLDFQKIIHLYVCFRPGHHYSHHELFAFKSFLQDQFHSVQCLCLEESSNVDIWNLVEVRDWKFGSGSCAPFPQLDTLIIDSPRMRSTANDDEFGRTDTFDYMIKVLADSFCKRVARAHTAPLRNLIIDGVRVRSKVINFYTAQTCGAVIFHEGRIVHDMKSINTFRSLSGL